jgi:hypothetical protein
LHKQGGKCMADTTNMQAEQAQTTEIPGTQTPTPEEKTDRDELKEASQQFFRTLFRAGVHLAMTPVSMLPEEPREHFVSAGREFTRGLATLARELADNFDKIVNEVKADVEKDL